MRSTKISFILAAALAITFTLVGAKEASASTCGNKTQEVGEQCDDGNQADGDGCSATCQVEAPCPTPVAPKATCGNDMVEAGEACDDGNQADGDGCSATCDAADAELLMKVFQNRMHMQGVFLRQHGNRLNRLEAWQRLVSKNMGLIVVDHKPTTPATTKPARTVQTTDVYIIDGKKVSREWFLSQVAKP